MWGYGSWQELLLQRGESRARVENSGGNDVVLWILEKYQIASEIHIIDIFNIYRRSFHIAWYIIHNEAVNFG